MKVCVIGTGAAGLAAIRHLLAKPDVFTVTAFEQGDRLGGTWVYTDQVGTDSHGLPVHSSMYKNLKTNLPKEVMAFPDFPFSKHLPSFVKHEDVLNYLDEYADTFGLLKHIKHEVANISRSERSSQWAVEVRRLDSKEVSVTEIFDAVMVCNGHYSIPMYPAIAGMDVFKGEMLHSHNYREPELYKDKIVLCVGGGASGRDIAIELSTCAKEVILYHRRPELFTTVLPRNVTQTNSPLITLTCDQKAVFEDGTDIAIDAVILCTGYHYTFPFLSPDCELSLDDDYIQPLYKHLIHTKYPTLSFIGIPKGICPFPMFDCQVKFVLAHLEGSMQLPTEEQMNEDAHREFIWRSTELNLPKRHAHTMGNMQWQYNDDLAALAGFQPVPKVVRKLYDHVHEYRVKELPYYKKREFILIDDNNFKEIFT